jgi:gamma-glutamyl:cysteine ligase YbdK (ATP-grasp superfamily)
VQTVEDTAHQIEIQNLLARINLPMARVEVRTDDGGNPLPVEIANLTLKHMLLILFYANPEFARSFRYDSEDIQRARRNELLASQAGLRAKIENPLTAKPVGMRDFLFWTLSMVQPLAEVLDLWADLEPLREMAGGGQNCAERWRTRVLRELEIEEFREEILVPVDLLKEFSTEHEAEVVRMLINGGEYGRLGPEAGKLGELLQYARTTFT